MKKTLRFFFAAICTLCASPSFSQQPWTSCNGPYGGSITGMDTFANYLWATTHRGGVYRSANNGQTWSVYNSGITFGPLERMHGLQNIGGKLFAVTTGQGVMRLTSASGTWTTVNGPSATGICKHGARIVVWSWSGVRYSADGGNSWQTATGLPSNGQPSIIDGVASNGNHLIATSNTSAGVMVYRSVDSGATWTSATQPPGFSSADAFAYLRTIGNRIFVGYYGPGKLLTYTTDGGLTWATIPNSSSAATHDIIYSNGMYHGSYGGGFMRYNTTNNPTYAPFSYPMQSYNIDCRKFYRFGSTVFIGTESDGLLRTDTLISSPQYANVGLNASPVEFLDGRGSRIIAMNALSSFSNAASGYHYSTNAGASWVRDSLPIFTTSHGTGPNASVQTGANWYIGTAVQGIYRSSNGGQTWRLANHGLPLTIYGTSVQPTGAMTVHPSGTVFIGNRNDVYKSVNDTSWTFVYSFPANSYNDPPVTAMLATSTYLFAGTSAGALGELYRSSNNGASWQNISSPGGFPTVDHIALVGNRLVISGGNGIQSSTDWGNTWTQFDSGIVSPLKYFRTLRTFRSKMYGIDDQTEKLYRLDSGGVVWTNLTPLPTDPRAVSVWASGDTVIYVGTKNNGVWKKSTATPTSVWQPATHTLDAMVYPNPSPSPNLTFQSRYHLPVSIRVYDAASGKVCAEAKSNAVPVVVPGASLPAGTYLLDVTDADGRVGRVLWTKTDK